jgi:hypothetical protein
MRSLFLCCVFAIVCTGCGSLVTPEDRMKSLESRVRSNDPDDLYDESLTEFCFGDVVDVQAGFYRGFVGQVVGLERSGYIVDLQPHSKFMERSRYRSYYETPTLKGVKSTALKKHEAPEDLFKP